MRKKEDHMKKWIGLAALLSVVLVACPDSGGVSDTQAPTVGILSPAIMAAFAATTTKITGTAKDNVAVTRLTYQHNGGAENDVSLTAGLMVNYDFDLTGLTSGENTIQVNAYDATNNKTSAVVKFNAYAPVAGALKIVGFVASQSGGAAVVGSQVIVENNPARALTDAKGRYELMLAPGRYNLDFVKATYAASRVEGLVIDASTVQSPFFAVQKVAFATTLPAKTPTATLQAIVGTDKIDFPMDEATALEFNAAQGIPLEVNVSAGDPSISPESTYLSVGAINTPGSGSISNPRLLIPNDPKNTTLTATVSLTGANLRGQRGATYLNFVTYDFNKNRLQRLIPIKLVDTTPNTAPLGRFASVKNRAITFAQKINFNGQPGTTAALVENSTMWVDLSWDYVTGLGDLPLGYRIWTSQDGTDYRLLRTLAGAASAMRDISPTLEAGQKVFYSIEAFNSSTSVMSDPVSTTPLASFRTTLVSPINRSRNISVRPDLTWSVDEKVGAYREFWVLVNDYPSLGQNCMWGFVLCGDSTAAANNVYKDNGSSPALSTTGNQYTVKFNENGKSFRSSLESFHSYTFDLSAAAFSSDGNAISISQDYYSIFYTLDTCNFGGPVCEGELSTFSTGNGSN
jgi:hypothetical protein